MPDRITKADVERRFESFLNATNRRKAKTGSDVGGYYLDYNPTYGGYVINRIVNKGGGVSNPFGMTRRSGRELIDAMGFALNSKRR